MEAETLSIELFSFLYEAKTRAESDFWLRDCMSTMVNDYFKDARRLQAQRLEADVQ